MTVSATMREPLVGVALLSGGALLLACYVYRRGGSRASGELRSIETELAV